MGKQIIIIGAGPAGLTAGVDLIRKGLSVTLLEKDPTYVGGISRTVAYKGYRFDIGGHRFFSKNQDIMAWWQDLLPNDFLKVRRLSRIFYKGTFFNYPLKVGNALSGLGLWTSALCVLSSVTARFFPIHPEATFQDWVSNRFGKVLFSIFFKTYTEKVWGIPCDKISADWAAQRIKNLSIRTAIINALTPSWLRFSKDVTTLIEEFQYPRLGPGMMWEKARDLILAQGGRVMMGEKVVKIGHANGRATHVVTRDAKGEEKTWEGDDFILSLPLQETVHAFDPPLSQDVLHAGDSLRYRAFLTVTLMIEKTGMFPDQWIYVHSPEVRLGRIQNFNNWSRFLVPTEGVTCLGLEYFCEEDDAFWQTPDQDLTTLGIAELKKIGLLGNEKVLDSCVVRMPKAYPVYTQDYASAVDTIRKALDGFSNLQVVGRNGMHKYNNQDHSMLTAQLAAKNIQGEKWNLWDVNAEASYHESTKG